MPLRVDIVTGDTWLYVTDLRLPGYIPMQLARRYRSGDAYTGPFGRGWQFSLDVRLAVEEEQFVFAPGLALEAAFARVDEGMQARHATGPLLQHHADTYVVETAPSRRYVFPKADARNGVIPLDRVEDADGNSIHFFYNENGLAGVVDTIGRQVRLAYRGGRVQRIRAIGHDEAESTLTVRTFRYDGQGRLVADTDAVGRTANFAYQKHLLVQYTNRLGGVQYAQYTADERCCALWRGDGSAVRRIAYDAVRQATRGVLATGEQIVYRHVPPGQVIEQIDPDGRSQNYYYDEAQRLVGFSDEEDGVEAFQQLDADEGVFTLVSGGERLAFLDVEEDGLVTGATDALDHRHVMKHDAAHRLARVVTPGGATWQVARDARGRVMEVVSPEERTVYIEHASDARTRTVSDELGRCYSERYDPFGRLIQREDALGRTQHRRYDTAGRLTEVRVGGQVQVAFEYDAAGLLVRATGAEQGTASLERDAFGRLRTYADPHGARYQFQYDEEGRLATVTKRQGATAAFEYDVYGRLQRAEGFANAVTTYRYEDGRIEAVAQHGDAEARRVYNRLGDLIREAKPDRGARRFEYGSSGELLSAVSKDAEGLFFDYEADGRVTRVEANGAALLFDYDREGNLQNARREGGDQLAFRYDARSRLVEIAGPATERIRLAYDAGNRLEAFDTPGRTVRFGYDALDRVIERRVVENDAVAERTSFADDGTAAIHADRFHLRPAEADGSTADRTAISLQLDQARHGLVLSLVLGDCCVPVWRRAGGPDRPAMSGAVCMAVGAVRGSAAVLGKTPRSAPEMLRCWAEPAYGGCRLDYTEWPTSPEVARPWALLDQFFLARPFRELYDPHHVLGALPHRRVGAEVRALDGWMTGPHVREHLRPPIWTHRSAGAVLAREQWVPGRGGVHPNEWLRMFLDVN